MTHPRETLEDAIRDVIARVLNLEIDISALDDADSLYDAGMNSHASVRLMLGLEEELDLEFPASVLRRSTFTSVRSIRAALEQIESGV